MKRVGVDDLIRFHPLRHRRAVAGALTRPWLTTEPSYDPATDTVEVDDSLAVSVAREKAAANLEKAMARLGVTTERASAAFKAVAMKIADLKLVLRKLEKRPERRPW